MSKSTSMAPTTAGMPLARRVIALVLLLALGAGATACARTPDGESRIKGVTGADDGDGGGELGRMSPTAGLEGGASGGQQPGEGPGSGLDRLTSGLGRGSGGSDPAGNVVPADLAGLPGAESVLALVNGTLGSTYTVDYLVDPTVMDHMIVANEPGRQSVHSITRDGTQRWTLYEGGQMTVDCLLFTTGPWRCQRVKTGELPLPGALTVDPRHFVAGLSGLNISPMFVLAALALPLQNSAGVASESYTTRIAGAPAECLKYKAEGLPPAEICANGDFVPVRLASSLTSKQGSLDFTFQAQAYSRGVARDAFTPPAPV